MIPMRRTSLTVLCLAMLSACVWGAFGSAPLLIAPLVWLGGFWLPGSALTLTQSVPARQRFDAIWLPFALGTPIFGAGICVARLAGLSLSAGALVTVVAGAGALLTRLWMPARKRAAGAADRPAGSDETATRPWLLPLVLGGMIFVLGVIPPLVNPLLRQSGDALLHLPVMQRVLAGSFPPDNPFLAGEPLAYFWFYHATLAGMVRLSGLPLDLVPVLFNAQALLLLLLALDRVGRRFGLSPVARATTLALLGIGLSPWGWIRLLYLQATHPEANWALFRATGISALLPVLNAAEPRLAGSLTKVAVTNALPMSLALAALAGLASHHAEGPDRLRWIRHSLFVAGCLAFHLVTGILLAAGLAVRWALTLVETRPRDRNWAAMVSLAAGVLVTLPYLIQVIHARSGSGATTFTLQIGRGFELHLALVGLVLLALPALSDWMKTDGLRLWLATGIPALFLPFFVHLIDGNEYKCVFLLLVLWSPLAGAGLTKLARSRAVPALLVLIPFVPTAFLIARGYALETPPGTLRPNDWSLAVRAGQGLPDDAILWKPDPGDPYARFTLPLARPVYLSDTYALQIMGQWDSAEARWRRGSLALAGVEDRTREALAAAETRLGRLRPLFALVTAGDARRYPHLESVFDGLGMPRVASNRLFAIYAFPPPRGP
jgi:hypothetical protein